MDEYVEDDYDVADADDEIEEAFCGRGAGDSESEDEFERDVRLTDTSSAQVRRGKDIQGIPWERLNVTREQYRQSRLEQDKNYENILQSG